MLADFQTIPFRFVLIPVWLVAFIGASIVYRRMKGKSVFRPHLDHPLFLETWRSGCSKRNLITKLGGATHCLWIAVDDGKLRVAPHFPFTLMFLPEIYGLEIEVDGKDVLSVERRPGLLASNRVRVRIARPNLIEEEFELLLHDPDAFIRAAETIRQAQ